MNHFGPNTPILNASLSRVPTTLAEIIELAVADPELDPIQRRDIISAIKRYADWRGAEPGVIPASHRTVAEGFEQLHPDRVDVEEKTIMNVRGRVQFALNRYARVIAPSRGKGLSAEWQPLWTLIANDDVRYRLSRLTTFCSARRIGPGAVNDIIIADFQEWLVNSTLLKRPDKVFRMAVLAWNKAAGTIPTWPKVTLAVPRNRTTYCLPWSDLPEGLRRDAEAWLERNANPDPFDEDSPLRPWAASTLDSRRFAIRQIASALHLSGYNIRSLDGLADLVEIETVKTALKFFFDPHKGTSTSQLIGLAQVLCTIAEHWVKVEEPHLKALKRIKGQITARRAHKGAGLTPKNRERLRELAQRENLIEFLAAPLKVLDRLRRKNWLTRADALEMQVAFAIELLLMAPVRRRSLLAIELDKHFLTIGRGRSRRLQLELPACIVKNGVDLSFPLPPESFEIIDFYIERCLPLLRKHEGSWLFPGDLPGSHKHPDQFSRQFSKTVHSLTGLTVNLHLMRHLGAKLYLDVNPGAYEVMRRVLGHKRMSTTINNYTGLETEAAVRHFDMVILGIRNGLLSEADND